MRDLDTCSRLGPDPAGDPSGAPPRPSPPVSGIDRIRELRNSGEARNPRVSAAIVLALALGLSSCGSIRPRAVGARRQNEDALAPAAAEMTKPGAKPWAVVQDGKLAATGPTAADAIRAAPGGDVAHRFVFRAEHRGDRLWRLPFLPEGGAVAGMRFLSDLGWRRVAGPAAAPGDGPARSLVLERKGDKRTLPCGPSQRLRLVVSPLAGGRETEVGVAVDPDFDGPLVLPAETARALDPALSEIPGLAEVQVLFGRPFDARRSWVLAKCPDLASDGAVELVVPLRPGER